MIIVTNHVNGNIQDARFETIAAAAEHIKSNRETYLDLGMSYSVSLDLFHHQDDQGRTNAQILAIVEKQAKPSIDGRKFKVSRIALAQ